MRKGILVLVMALFVLSMSVEVMAANECDGTGQQLRDGSGGGCGQVQGECDGSGPGKGECDGSGKAQGKGNGRRCGKRDGSGNGQGRGRQG